MTPLGNPKGNKGEPPAPRAPVRRLFDAGAAVVGVAAGVFFAEPVLAGAAGLWHGFVLPAYDELIKNGLLAWCF